MNRLEERYRHVLRLLPAPYRQAWEDDMVAAFLESTATDDPDRAAYLADYGRPGGSEVASVASLAVRLRLGAGNGRARTEAWDQAVRLAVLVAVLVNAVAASVGIAVTLWLSGRLGWLPSPPAPWAPAPPGAVWRTAWEFLSFAWLPAYVALVLGHRRAAQAVAVLAIVPSITVTAVLQATGEAPLALSPWTMALIDVLVVLAMAVFPATTAPLRPGTWLLAVPVGVLLVPVPLFVLPATGHGWTFLDWPGLLCAVVTAAMLGYLAARALHRTAATPAWPLALALLAATVLVLRLVTLPDYRLQVTDGALLGIAVVQLLVVLVVLIPLAGVARQALRRLPRTGGGLAGPV